MHVASRHACGIGAKGSIPSSSTLGRSGPAWVPGERGTIYGDWSRWVRTIASSRTRDRLLIGSPPATTSPPGSVGRSKLHRPRYANECPPPADSWLGQRSRPSTGTMKCSAVSRDGSRNQNHSPTVRSSPPRLVLDNDAADNAVQAAGAIGVAECTAGSYVASGTPTRD